MIKATPLGVRSRAEPEPVHDRGVMDARLPNCGGEIGHVSERVGRTVSQERPQVSADTAQHVALKLSGIECSFGGVQAVAGVSFDVMDGEFVGLIGPNGAGKSTLLDCVSGLNRSYRGRVVWDGRDITRWPLHRVAQAGLVRTFQVPRLFRRMTALSNVMVGPRNQLGENLGAVISGSWRRQESELLAEAYRTLRRFDLSYVANNYGSDLSGGQERLLELCRAIMFRPRMLLLDEPFAGVSPTNRRRLADLLTGVWRDEKVTIVMVEHRLEWIEELCNRILVMANGTLIAQGSMADVRKNREVVDSYLGGALE